MECCSPENTRRWFERSFDPATKAVLVAEMMHCSRCGETWELRTGHDFGGDGGPLLEHA